jgi:hypothetical protein
VLLKKVKKALSSLLVGLMVVGPAAGAVSAAGTDVFSDVGTTHWAFKDIMKMSARHIIMGDGTGKFLPTDSVSQEQALAMALRAMGHKPEVDSYDTSSYNLDYRKVSNWAKGAVAIADQYGLLKSDEKSRFTGNSPATREWIAQLLVRTIGKDNEVSSYTSQSSNFSDNGNISDWANSYVNLAASSTYGLLRGIPNADGSVSFNPKGSVKRAEMAALLSRADKYLPAPDDQTIGQVTAISPSQLTLQTQSGQQQLSLSADTVIFENGSLSTSSSITQGQTILAIGKPSAVYIENVDATSAAQIVNGTLVKIFPALNSIVIKDASNQMKTYTLTAQTTYSDQTSGSLTSDQLGDNDSVQLSLIGGKVISVMRVGSGGNLSNAGTIYEVDLDHNLLTLQNSSGIPQVYSISADTTVTYPDNRTTGLAGLVRGMKIKLTMNNGVASAIQVNTLIEQGTVISLSADKTILTYSDANGKPKVQTLASATTVTFSDDTAATLADIKVNDAIQLTIDSSGVTNIKLTNRSLSTSAVDSGVFIEGSIAAVDQVSKTLILKKSDGTLASYKYDSIPQLFINGVTNPTMNDIKMDMPAKLQLDNNNQISYLNIDNRIQGSVYLVDPTQHVLTISLPTGMKTYTVDPSATVTIYKQYTSDLSDIHRNDLVRVNADANNIISAIDVQKTIVYKVTSVTDVSKWIGASDSAGNGVGLNLDATTLLKIPGITQPAVTNVKQDDMVKATYIGNDLQEVDVMPTLFGSVTSVNATNQTFTVQKYDGTSVTIPFSSGDVIKYDNTQSSSLTALAVGDRVEVNANFTGQNEIYKMLVVTDQVNALDSQYIYLLSMKSYRYSYNVYVHQGVNNLTTGSLQKNDAVTLYIFNNTVYEINKTN